MPKRHRDVRAALLEAGWEVVRQRGSQEVWAHPQQIERVVVAGGDLPGVPGVVALGASREEVSAGIEEALVAYAEDLAGRGLGLPAPHHAVAA